MSAVRVPVATYRIQFTRDFRFLDCRDLVSYLHKLGIGDLYSSPRFRARRGSSHGYDVTHPGRVNSELGTDEDFEDLCEKLAHYGMGLVLDIVPNHMAASHENPWWMDVLQNGPGSPYADFFDIDWRPATSKASLMLEDRVLLPVLGDLYGDVLERGEFSLSLDETGLYLHYYERRFPLDPCSYAPVLRRILQRVEEQPTASDGSAAELKALEAMVGSIPPRTALDPSSVDARRELSVAVKQRLFHLYRDHMEARHAIDAALWDLCNVQGRPEAADALDAIIGAQGYRLAHWKVAYEEINYRRFFDINDLVGLRVEDDRVFRTRHEPILKLVKERRTTGLRIDHIDGLHDPQAYLERLQTAADGDGEKLSLYVVVEKILGRGERLPEDWRACGTTGYDFLNVLNDVLVSPDGLKKLEETYANFTDEHQPFAEICYARNKQVLWKLFAGEVHELGHRLCTLAAQDRQARDIPLSELMDVLVETTACLPVYRTYIRSAEIGLCDRRYIERTVELARRRTSEIKVSKAAFDFFLRVLLVEPPPYARDQKQEWLRFVMRWQQFTGPVMAKGLEDTAFYAYNCLISRNEVGGDPLRERPPHSRDEFHDFLAERQRRWPYSMNTTSTHDTKRSEDVRARINVLSETPDEWNRNVERWVRWNAPCKTHVEGVDVPCPSEEILIYQSLVGAWPLSADDVPGFPDRLKTFLVKALREAKTYSGWLRPNLAHEGAVLEFAEKILVESDSNRFLPDFLRFQERIAFHGAFNSLSQVLLKIASPGVPDFYQGAELWDFSLVDPDNRRPVDYLKRISVLDELHRQENQNPRRLLKSLIAGWKDGALKLYVTNKALDFRRAHAVLFRDGDFLPAIATGARESNAVSFFRRHGSGWVLAIAPRWTTQLAPFPKPPIGARAWQDTVLRMPEGAPGSWRHVLTGETFAVAPDSNEAILPLKDVLGQFPVALLVGVQ